MQRLTLQATCAKSIPEDCVTDEISKLKTQSLHAVNGDAEVFLSSLSKALETTVIDSLDDVWRLKDVSTPYPETRMRGLLEAIAGWITRLLLSYLNPLEEHELGACPSPIWSSD